MELWIFIMLGLVFSGAFIGFPIGIAVERRRWVSEELARFDREIQSQIYAARGGRR